VAVALTFEEGAGRVCAATPVETQQDVMVAVEEGTRRRNFIKNAPLRISDHTRRAALDLVRIPVTEWNDHYPNPAAVKQARRPQTYDRPQR
jgi:hypothetical protein